jgi:hypothetical protein|eukprot:COSAG06_NODE_13186_length_1284_cov_2.006751_2_plen_235_part_00
MFGGGGGGMDGGLIMHDAPKRRCGCLKNWKPLEGATLGMVYTYFLLFITLVFMGVGIWHCRANRLSTEVSCTSDGCRVLKQVGSVVELDQDLPRSTIIAASAVRMEDAKVVETKGLKKRQIQRLNYGAVIKFRSEAGDPAHPDRGARLSSRRTPRALHAALYAAHAAPAGPRSEGCAAVPAGCVSWRQTGSCDPQGEREPNFDKPCNVSCHPPRTPAEILLRCAARWLLACPPG